METRDIILTVDKRWYDALSSHLEELDTSIEVQLHETLLDMLLCTLPEHEYLKIDNEIRAEQKLGCYTAALPGRLSVFRITQNGRTEHLLTEGDGAMDTLHTALRLREYLATKDSSSARFAQAIPAADAIAPEVFREYADEMRQDAERVIAALDIDLDRDTISTMAGADGWQTYSISNVLKAAWKATLTDYIEWNERRCIFADQLEDKLIAQDPTGIMPPAGPVM